MCNDGWEGDGFTCTDIDECANGTADCPENSTCTNQVGGFNCACDEGFRGNNGLCEEAGDPSGGDDGCNATGSSSPAGALLLLALAGLACRRRRRPAGVSRPD